MNLTGKSVLYLAEAVVVAGIVIWFVWKDPFKLFSQYHLTMAETTLDIKNIRSIGQMVTSEYYGEVIASLPESKLSFDQNFYETTFSDLYDSIIVVVYRTDSIVKTLKKPWLKGKFSFFYQYYHELNSGLTSNMFYYPVMIHLDSLYEYNVFHKPENFKKTQDYSDDIQDYEEPVIRKLWENIDKNTEPYEAKPADFPRTYRKFVRSSPFKSERKKEILVLGRGWVKAGINFGTLNAYNFKFLKDKGIIHFYRVLPTILYHDINPWLVPNKIHGFDFLKISGKATNNDDIVSVKRECVAKLTQQAIDSHILEKAKENAEQNLKSFFSLITGTDIRQVKFITSKYEAYNDIFSDKTLSKEQFLNFDTICRRDVYTMDTTWYKSMKTQRDELDSFFYQVKNQKLVRVSEKLTLPVTKYTGIAINCMADRKIDSTEVQLINTIYTKEIQLNTFSKLDSFWYKTWQERNEDFLKVTRAIINIGKPPVGMDTVLLKKIQTMK